MDSPDTWFRIVVDLDRHMSLREIGEKTGASASSIHRYKSGAGEPRFSIGTSLVELHSQRCVKASAE